MTKPEINIQDAFLFNCLKNKPMVRVDLVTGQALEGHLRRFDRFAIVLEREGKEILVYKHAIATLESAPTPQS